MDTEKKLVYSIINALKGSEYNNDEELSERLVRSLVHTYRVDSIRKEFDNGMTVSDELFQTFNLTLTKTSDLEYSAQLPKVIRFDDYGFYLEKNNVPIPILSSLQYFNSIRQYYGEAQPKAKTEQNKLTVYLGKITDCIQINSDVYTVIKAFGQEVLDSGINPVISVTFKAILLDPSDDPTYDWETTVFPFPAERIRELKQQILVTEFPLMQQAPKDEIQNTRVDEIRYHDQDDVNQTGRAR